MNNISIDTRTLSPGDIYIPVKGAQFDGHDFIDEAIKKGASKIITTPIDEYAKKYRKKLKTQIIGITGSFGKTTMKDKLHSIFSQRYPSAKTEGNNNNEVGVPLTILRTNSTDKYLFCEMAMRAKGEIDYLRKIARPQHVIITGIGKTHMEFFKNAKEIAKAKAEIMGPPLKSDPKTPRYAFIPYESEFYEFLKKKAEKFGYLVMPFTGETGPEQAMNCIHTVARQFGLSEADVKAGLKAYTPSKHRLEIKEFSGITLVDDSYNSNPDAVKFALKSIKPLKGRKVIVLGDMGELGAASQEAHKNLEEDLIDNEVDVVFTIGEEIKVLESEHLNITHFNSQNELNKLLLNEIKKGDVILIKASRSLGLDKTADYIETHYE